MLISPRQSSIILFLILSTSIGCKDEAKQSDGGGPDGQASLDGGSDKGAGDQGSGGDGPGADGNKVDGVKADGTAGDSGKSCTAPLPKMRILLGGDSKPLRTLLSDKSGDSSYDPKKSSVIPGAVSGDGKVIVFTEESGNSLEVYKMAADLTGTATLISVYKLDPDGKPPVKYLDSDLTADESPVLNTTGAMARWLAQEDDYSGVMSYDSAKVSLLTDMDKVFPRMIAMSAAGVTAVAYWECTGSFGKPFYCDPRSDGRIGLLQGGKLTKAATAKSVIDPAVSPDGKTLAYVDELTQGGLKRIYTVPAAGGAAVAITARAVGKETLRTPKLSNSQVVYVRFDMGKSTVERAPVDGSKKPEVLFSHGGDVRIALSSDGKLLVINARKNTLSSAATIYGQDFSTSCAAVKLIETTAGFGKIAVQ